LTSLSRQSIGLAALIAAAGSLIHAAALVAGPDWYASFHAPPAIVASARAGTALAPLATSAIALLMACCSLYACAALDLVRRPPLLRAGLAAMAAVCLPRALLLAPLAVTHPELRNTFELVAALAWGLAGVGFALGCMAVRGRAASSLSS
jgi:ABC-type polysaccharide/polyol phosphate export permease